MTGLKKILGFILRLMAGAVLRKYRPKIVAVTGSVGKTTTKELIYTVLRTRHFVRRSTGNYNNEIGMPLTILGAATGNRNLFLWLRVFARFLRLMAGSAYPEILVLEMGADRAGDLKYLTKLAPPDISVVTRVGEAHSEFFGSIEAVAAEKAKLVEALTKRGIAILNFDDPRVLALKRSHHGKTITYGLSEGANIRALNAHIEQSVNYPNFDPARDIGVAFSLVYKTKALAIFAAGSLGFPHVYAMLAAFCVGQEMGIATDLILQSFGQFAPLPGRLRPLSGIKNTILIDDTYNASPEAVVEALRVLKQLHGRRRVAVLGDMLELGPFTERAHRTVAHLVYDARFDLLVTVGERAKFIADEARMLGFPKTKILEYDRSEDAALPLQNKMQEGDVVLIKGSRGVHMEKIVLEVMAEPERAEEMLVH